MSVYIDRDQLENFAMNCVGGMVNMKQIHEFPAADKIMELITLKALADAKIERLEARLEQTRWIPVTERLPQDGMEVLAWSQSGFAYVDWFIDGKWKVNGLVDGKYEFVTHWMPLPAPPEEVEP